MSDNNKASRRKKRRELLRWVRRFILLVIAAGALAAVVIALIPKPVSVSIVAVEEGFMKVSVNEDGRTRVKDRYVVSSPLAGHLPRISFRAGDEVKESNVIARLVPLKPQLLNQRTKIEAQARLSAAMASQQQARAVVSKAEAALSLAETDRGRQKALWDKQATTQRELDLARFQERAHREDLASARLGVKVARQNAAMARAALGRIGKKESDEEFIIQAPIAGRVLKVIQQSGQVVQPGTPLVELGDPGALELVIDILTQDAIQIAPGAPTSITRWGGDTPLRGHVRRIEPSAFTRVSALGIEEQRVNAVIDLDSPREQWMSLGDGYRVEVEIQTWAEDEVTQVPASSVFRQGDGWALFAVVDGTASLTPVTIGKRNRTHVQILSGVNARDKIVLHPSDQVRDGTSVAD